MVTMKKDFICLLFLIMPAMAIGQTFPFELWHDGKVVLDDGDTIKGSVKYDLQDLLQVRHQNRMESFSAGKFYSLRFLTRGTNGSERFILCPTPPTAVIKARFFSKY